MEGNPQATAPSPQRADNILDGKDVSHGYVKCDDIIPVSFARVVLPLKGECN